MDQEISTQFRIALLHLLEKEGRGAQARLADEQQIDRGYLNSIIKGRRKSSDAIRTKVSDHFNIPFADMLILGRRILNGEEGSDLPEEEKIEEPQEEEFSPEPHEEEPVDFDAVSRRRDVVENISATTIKAIEILNSGTEHAERLAEQIEVIYEAISARQKNLSMRNKLIDLEARVTSLEKGHLQESA